MSIINIFKKFILKFSSFFSICLYNLTQFPGVKIAWDEYFNNIKVKFFYQSPYGGCYKRLTKANFLFNIA